MLKMFPSLQMMTTFLLKVRYIIIVLMMDFLMRKIVVMFVMHLPTACILVRKYLGGNGALRRLGMQ